MRKSNCKLLAALVVAVLSISSTGLLMPLHAQSSNGSIVGNVADPSGAIVPGAKVAVINIGTNEKRESATDASGLYRFVNLAPASYRLEVDKTGFKHITRQPIEVQVGRETRIDVAMQIGAATETVQVTTETPLLQTDSGAVSETVEGQRVQEMPLNGRNTMNLIALTPGVVAMAPSGASALNMGTHTGLGVWSDYSIGGGFSGANAMYLDGATVNLMGGTSITLIPTQDSTQEFSVMSSGISAEYGRYGGGVINMTTKSGTNQWHGSVYEYFRNKVLNANNFFSNRQGVPRGKWNQDQYGVTLGNPIVKDKVFSFFSWEGFRLLYGYPNITYVPTPAMRTGKFYKSTIKDPLATQLGRSGCITSGTDAGGAYQQIVAGCIDPTATAMLSYFPAENYPAGDNNASIGYNYVSTPVPSTGNNANQYTERVDYNLRDKQRLFARYTYWTQADIPYGQLGNFTKNAYSTFRSTQGTLGDTYTINQTSIVDVRLSYSRNYNDNAPPTLNTDLTSLGGAWGTFQTQLFPKYFPSPHINSTKEVAGAMYPFSGMSVYSQAWLNTYDLTFSLTKLVGKHNMKFGGEIRMSDSNGPGNGFGAAGNFTFQESGAGIAGDSWADFLFGVPSSASVTKLHSFANFNWYKAFYANDVWQVSRKLTLNLGLRWELPGSNAEKHNWATVLLPNTTDPNNGILGYQSLVATSAYPSRYVTDMHNGLFAPRIGFAYRITSKDVIRGGFGITYPDSTPAATSPVNSAGTSYNNNPGTGATVYAGTAYAGQYIVFSNPFPATAFPTGINQPVGNSIPTWTTTLNKSSLSGNVSGQSYPRVEQWNFSVGHQFKGDIAAEISYSGMAGRNLYVAVNLNELPQQYWDLAHASYTYTPYGAGFASGKYYQKVTVSNDAIGENNYNSGMIKVEKRFRSGGVISGNYTYARGLSDTETGAQNLTSSAPSAGTYVAYAAQDPMRLRQVDYSLSAWNINHRAMISYVMNLPFGNGQKWAHYSGVAGAMVSGWSVNGITNFQKGFPMSIAQSSAGLTLDTYGYTIRPSVVAGCNPALSGSGKNRLGQWFNTACYAKTANFTYGTEPRVDPKVRTDGIANWDLSLLKATKIKDNINAQFRAEFFNLFNHPQFAAPDNGITDAAFGAVSAQYNNPRLIQFSLRISF